MINNRNFSDKLAKNLGKKDKNPAKIMAGPNSIIQQEVLYIIHISKCIT